MSVSEARSRSTSSATIRSFSFLSTDFSSGKICARLMAG
jgi:hypothetical protein